MSEEYAKKLNIAVSECACEKCQYMCQAPCCGSVENFEKLIDAGYADRLMFDNLPSAFDAGNVLKPALKGYEGKRAPWEVYSAEGCTFWTKDKKCELHKKGLKPIQGKLALHGESKIDDLKYADISREDWESPRGLALIEKWKKLVNYKEDISIPASFLLDLLKRFVQTPP